MPAHIHYSLCGCAVTERLIAMKDYPLFSVVVLHYKQWEYWKEAVQSVLDQDYPRIQLVFSDDGSPGFSRKKVEEYIQSKKKKNIEDYVVLDNKINQGTASNCDTALRSCVGEYVLLLDGDDALFSGNVLRKFADEFHQLPERENIVTADCLMCDVDMNPEKQWYSPEIIAEKNSMTAAQQYQSLYCDFFPVPSATALRRSVFEKCGGFRRPYVRLAQDGYYYIHLARLGERFHVADFVAAKHRSGGVCSPIGEKPSPNVIEVREETLKIGEFEVFPYLSDFTAEQREKVCQRYYENLISYRIWSNRIEKGISEPTYSILKAWAERKNIPWCFYKSKLRFFRDDQQWKTGCNTKVSLAASKEKCCGCTACKNVCPVSAITMAEDEQGFLYPKIDNEKCIGCNRCQQVCPMSCAPEDAQEPISYLAVKHRNPKVRRNSRSGGVFAAMAGQVLRSGGVVYGAAFDEDLTVKHIRIDQETDIVRLQGSKYVQSDMGDSFSNAAADLKAGIPVLFSGTPCQIDGLKRYLGKGNIDPDKLLLVDIVCHGAPSPKVYREYCEYLEHCHQGHLETFNFRDKETGWSSHFESAQYICNGKLESLRSNQYATLFQKDIMLRPSCFSCPYACYERVSDVTIGDFWGIEKALPEFADDLGTSLVMPHTEKGAQILRKVRWKLDIRATEKPFTVQPNLERPSSKGANCDAFWEDYNRFGIQPIIDRYAVNAPVKAHQKGKTGKIHKVGILTFHRAHNFGAMLQAWALKSFLRDCGYDAFLINYVSKRIDHTYAFIPWQITPRYCDFRTPDDPKRGLKMYLRELIKAVRKYPAWWVRRRRFQQFMGNQLQVRGPGLNFEQLKNVKLDAVICGSDQIWTNQDPAYYAAFQTDAKKIAYAPSIGNGTFPPDMHKTIYEWIKDFDALSVREPYLSEYIGAVFGLHGTPVTLDPTLLLTAEDYRPLICERETGRKYVYCYAVLENDAMVTLAAEMARANGWELIVERYWLRDDVDDFQIQHVDGGPKEFLSLIYHAQYVVTNSFHGTVFSILFHKRFYSVYGQDENCRIDSLLQTAALTERHIADTLPETETSVDWDDVDEKLATAREASVKFLLQEL